MFSGPNPDLMSVSAHPGARPAEESVHKVVSYLEQNDLLLTMAEWSPLTQAAFLELTTELLTTYPALPVN